MEPRMATAARGGTGAAPVAGVEAAESADTMGIGSWGERLSGSGRSSGDGCARGSAL